MLGDDMRETVKKVPLLGDIPGLGQLFKSTDYQEGKSQVVILITPRVVIPGSAENQQMRDDIEKQMFAPDGTLQRKP
jgi:pilus assembly protein CpaC